MTKVVITISETFPSYHINAGLPTDFVAKLSSGIKKHTLRNNYPLWKKRFEKINAGKAVLSIRVWEGKPYHSKQREIMQLTNKDGVGLEKVEFIDGELSLPTSQGILINADKLAENDGLSPAGFVGWFKDQDLSGPMAIIHFTSLRYGL